MRRYIAITAAILSATTAYATGDSLIYLLPTDTVIIRQGVYGEKIYTHYMAQGQTLYSLSKFYGMSVEELYYYNPGLNNRTLHAGDGIRLPIPNKAIIRTPREGMDLSQYVPIYYEVSNGETLYGIAKRSFKLDPEELKLRNDLSSTILKTGQLLHVGYLSIAGVKEEDRAFRGGPLTRRNHALMKVYRSSIGNRKEVLQVGKAYWNKKSKEEMDFYCTHRTARLNSIIQVFNPMSKTYAYVKVIGKVPSHYPAEIICTLSPKAAKFLGARDQEFYVQVTTY